MNQLQSDNISDLIKDLIIARQKINHAPYDSKNPHFSSEFASLESNIDATAPALLEHGLVVLQQPALDESGRNVLVTTLAHSSGQWMRSYTEILNEKKTCQSMGSGLSYARRYALAAMLGIGQADDDGHKATEKDVPPPSSRPAAKPSARPNQPLLSPGEFVITFGEKFKGAQVKDLSSKELETGLKFVRDQAKKDNKPLWGQEKLFEEAAVLWLDHLKSQKEPR